MISLHHRMTKSVRAGIAALALGGVIAAAPGVAHADATDDYPIPKGILKTSCTAEQIMAAAREPDRFSYCCVRLCFVERRTLMCGSVTWLRELLLQ